MGRLTGLLLLLLILVFPGWDNADGECYAETCYVEVLSKRARNSTGRCLAEKVIPNSWTMHQEHYYLQPLTV